LLDGICTETCVKSH